MNESYLFLTDEWKNLPCKTREYVSRRDGTPWTESRDPVMRERIIERVPQTGAKREKRVGRSWPVHQEICADLVALIQRKKRRSARVLRRTGRVRAARSPR